MRTRLGVLAVVGAVVLPLSVTAPAASADGLCRTGYSLSTPTITSEPRFSPRSGPVAAVGKLLGLHRRFSGAPEPVRRP
jgi:hypothetical protein